MSTFYFKDVQNFKLVGAVSAELGSVDGITGARCQIQLMNLFIKVEVIKESVGTVYLIPLVEMGDADILKLN